MYSSKFAIKRASMLTRNARVSNVYVDYIIYFCVCFLFCVVISSPVVQFDFVPCLRFPARHIRCTKCNLSIVIILISASSDAADQAVADGVSPVVM